MLAAAPERGKWGRRGAKGSKFAPKKAAPAPAAEHSGATPVKLAAKGKKAAANKQAPVTPAAAPKSKPKPKVKGTVKSTAKPTAKKGPAKKNA